MKGEQGSPTELYLLKETIVETGLIWEQDCRSAITGLASGPEAIKYLSPSTYMFTQEPRPHGYPADPRDYEQHLRSALRDADLNTEPQRSAAGTAERPARRRAATGRAPQEARPGWGRQRGRGSDTRPDVRTFTHLKKGKKDKR